MNVITCFSFTAVPLFFMMSGYLILNSEKTADISFLFKKRLPHLVIPLAGWSAVAVLYRLLNDRTFSLKNLYDGLVSSFSQPAWIHLWYMYTLIALYVISPFVYGALNQLDRKGHALVLSIIALISAKAILKIFLPDALQPFLNIDILSKLTFWNGTLATFILGYYLGNIKKKIPNVALIGTAVAVLAVIVIGTYKYTVNSGEFNQTFQNQYSGFEIILASCVFLIFKQNFNKDSKFLQAIPVISLSLPIYLMHNILLSAMGKIIHISTFADTVWVTLLNFFICFVVMKTVATIKPICFIATGMSYDTACKTCNWVYTFNRISAFLKNK